MESTEKTKEELLSELTLLRQQISEIQVLKMSEEKYRRIVENANSIIMLMDTKGNITFFNQYAQRFFGFYEKEILGKNVVGTIVPENNFSGQDLVAMIEDIVKNPERHSANDNENMRRNGERVHILWTNKAIVSDDGNIKEILCIGNKVVKTGKS